MTGQGLRDLAKREAMVEQVIEWRGEIYQERCWECSEGVVALYLPCGPSRYRVESTCLKCGVEWAIERNGSRVSIRPGGWDDGN